MARTLAYNKLVEVDATVKVADTLYRVKKDYRLEVYDSSTLCIMRTSKEPTNFLHSPRTGARLGGVRDGGLELSERVFDNKKSMRLGLEANPPEFNENTTSRTKQIKMKNYKQTLRLAKAGFFAIRMGGDIYE